jgi:hypothetical protein
MAGKNRIFLATAVGVLFVAAVAVIVLGRRSPDGEQAPPAHDAAQGAAELDASAQAETPADARRRADELRARIHALIVRAKLEAGAELVADAQRAPRAAPSASPTRAELLVDRYLRAIAREEFLPMASACYGDLVKHSPNARGKVLLHIVVVGHPAAGGVVDSVQLDSGSTLDDPQLMDCLVESMLALSFGAPPEGQARLEFDYPFEFPDSDARD